jgi:hypothetical protein
MDAKIHKMAEEIYLLFMHRETNNELDPTCRTLTVTLPIQRIASIHVNVFLVVSRRLQRIFVEFAHAHHQAPSSNTKMLEYTSKKGAMNGGTMEEKLRDVIQVFVNSLPKLVFYKYKGCFEIKDEPFVDESNICSLFENETIVLKAQTCAVCFQYTKTKTSCHHTLCMECWCNIHRVNNVLCCPLCRKDISN